MQTSLLYIQIEKYKIKFLSYFITRRSLIKVFNYILPETVASNIRKSEKTENFSLANQPSWTTFFGELLSLKLTNQIAGSQKGGK